MQGPLQTLECQQILHLTSDFIKLVLSILLTQCILTTELHHVTSSPFHIPTNLFCTYNLFFLLDYNLAEEFLFPFLKYNEYRAILYFSPHNTGSHQI